MTRYAFRDASAPTKDAQLVGEALESIRLANGGQLTPEATVEAAKTAASPLHKKFTWSDKEAGPRWRLHEARNLIKSVRVVYEETNEQAPAFVTVRNMDNQRYYQSAEVAVHSVTEFESALREAKVKMDAAANAFEELKRMASGSDDNRVAILAIVIDSLGTARAALDRLPLQ